MKKTGIVILALLTLSLAVPMVFAGKDKTLNYIPSGLVESSTGEIITTGYDMWGYNYQAHMYNGWYENYQRPAVPVEGEIWLQMKWNDAWLANFDSDDADLLLDRHYGYDSYIGSGAWLTNHMVGTNEDDGTEWTYFVKIVAVPFEAELVDGDWYLGDERIGYMIWGEFAVIQEFENNYHADYNPDGINHFVFEKSDLPLGFGIYPAEEIPAE